ncbi:DUF1778 domain-containing protein (plasmid) [Rhizobium acidisoli]|uniref:DUF1778 domain-containing protein n=2 Tax=Rhizobium acidisoli TaxID=1538158 RepID=A0AAE6C426_9HYPH|nr:DUF1778 domain-containing protein [Rhizobium acidisoli]
MLEGGRIDVDIHVLLRQAAASPIYDARILDEKNMADQEIMRQAAINEAQTAILQESVIRLSPDAFKSFVAAVEAGPSTASPKITERLQRKAPWEK